MASKSDDLAMAGDGEVNGAQRLCSRFSPLLAAMPCPEEPRAGCVIHCFS